MPALGEQSSQVFKGKLAERPGRKATGLRDLFPTTAGLPRDHCSYRFGACQLRIDSDMGKQTEANLAIR
jgi:hypothetical protein